MKRILISLFALYAILLYFLNRIQQKIIPPINAKVDATVAVKRQLFAQKVSHMFYDGIISSIFLGDKKPKILLTEGASGLFHFNVNNLT